jgi:hypothetical protein
MIVRETERIGGGAGAFFCDKTPSSKKRTHAARTSVADDPDLPP